MKTKILDKYNNAENFFNMLLELLRELESQKAEKEDKALIKINCDFILYFILLEQHNILPNNYRLFIERISDCTIVIEQKHININFFPSCFSISLFISNFSNNYLNKGINFTYTNEPAIIAVNKKSAIWRINDLRKNNICSLIRDIKTVESNFSKEVDHILKS